MPGPTGAQFLEDRHFVKVIGGPIGSGKSTVCLFDLLKRSVEQVPFDNVRRTRHILVRNTSAQLRSTVKPLIDQWFVHATNDTMGKWRLTDGIFEARFRLPDDTIVHAEFMMLPADTPDDVRRLLSLEGSAAWLEECREIDPEVAQALQGRVARYPNRNAGGVTYPGVIGSTNAPPLGSWWQQKMADPPDTWRVFMQPPALLDDGSINPATENLANLDPNYYRNLISGKTQDWIDVYLRNHFGSGGFGEPVFARTFRREFHLSKTKLTPIYDTLAPLVVGMDNGLTAAAVIGQMDPRGRVNVLGECYVPEGDSMGVETFLDTMLVPYLNSRFPVRPEHIAFALDPACFNRSEVNELTIAQAVAARGFHVIPRGAGATNHIERRIAAVEGLLSRAIDGGPGLLVSPECPWLTQALVWGYRNKKLANGSITAEPEKNHYSHIADALQYLCLYYNVLTNPIMAAMRPTAKEVKRVAFRYA